MKSIWGFVAIGVIALAGGFAIGVKKPALVIHPPAVVIHDTVSQVQFKTDTIRLTKTIETVKLDTVWRTREIVSAPETLKVVPELFGVTGFKAGRALGDTTTFMGFHLKPDSMMSGAYTLNGWIHQDITPGPVDGFLMYGDGTLKAGYDPHGFPQACTVADKGKWAAIGAGSITLLRAVFGR